MNNKEFQKVMLKSLRCLLMSSVTLSNEDEQLREARREYLKSTVKMLDEILALMEVANE